MSSGADGATVSRGPSGPGRPGGSPPAPGGPGGSASGPGGPSGAAAWALDVVLAALAAYAALVLTREISGGLPGPAVTFALGLAAVHGGVLLLRRRSPAGVLLVQGLTGVGYAALGLPVVMLGPATLVTLYTAGARLPRRSALILLAAAQVVLAVLLGLAPWRPSPTSWLQFAGLLGAAWFLGDVVRRWQVAAAAHARRATELEQAREELARLAVTAERVRIARELHDVVAHSMSIIAMHAGSGRLAADRDPAAAQRALAVVERTSREALAELRRLVGVLRDTGEDGEPGAPLTPAPGLPDVHRLVAEVATAGVRVDVRTDGDLGSVPDGVSLAAYRIVQEALTNVVRHAAPASARLSVTVTNAEVTVEVVDDGRAAHADGAGGSGHGTVGMRERAALYGGTVTAGPQPGGGWRVAARLPRPPGQP